MENLTKKQKVRRLAETAIMLALASVLSELAVVDLPFGGKVTVFSQVPMLVIAYRYGFKWGVVAGLATGIVQTIFGLGNFSYVSGIVAYIVLLFADYIVAYGALCMGGAFKNKIKNPVVSISVGAALACTIRYICHFVSGVTIWADYADGFAAVWKYSLTYNASYMLPELIVTVVGCAVLASIFDLISPEIRVRKRS